MKNIALTLASLSLALAHAPQALAQTHCSSDGAPKPVALFERFISADCEACWGDAATPAPSAKAGAVVLDWIVPSAQGDDAPLSAAATNDAALRLQALARQAPAGADVFEVPLAFLMNPAHHRHHVFEAGGMQRQWFSMPYEDGEKQRFIWGETAGMLRNLYRFLSA